MKSDLEQLLRDILANFSEPAGESDDDWNVYDASGGNVDDAYSFGLDDGKASSARRIREIVRNAGWGELL